MKEIYKAIPEWSNFLVSNLGNVKSVDRTEKFRGTTRIRVGRMMKQRILRKYFCVGFKQEGRCKGFFVHRLVALCFVKNPNNYPVVNHKDSDRLNNRFDNLEWCTQKMNIHHAMKEENWTRGEGHGNAKLTNEQVKIIRERKSDFVGLAKELGICYGTIKTIRRGKSWAHL